MWIHWRLCDTDKNVLCGYIGVYVIQIKCFMWIHWRLCDTDKMFYVDTLAFM